MHELVQGIERAIEMSLAERELTGNAARALYEQQASEFKERLYAYLQPIVAKIQGLSYEIDHT